MNDFEFYDETDLNWVSQQLKIAHLVNESKIKDKYNELTNFFIENDSYLHRHEKIQSKSLNNLLKEISRLRIEVLYLEKELGHIDDTKQKLVLITNKEMTKMLNSFQINMEINKQKIYNLQIAIEEQRNDYMIKINEEKKEKEEIRKDYDQVIEDLWQEIKQTEVQLFSSHKAKESKSISIEQEASANNEVHDYKQFLEMKSAEFFLNAELEDSYSSLKNIQRKFERESLNMEELKNDLEEIENICSNYRKEISNLNNQHTNCMTRLDEMSRSQWKQKEITSFSQE